MKRIGTLVALLGLAACKSDPAALTTPEIGADEPAPAAVCAHMDAVRTKKPVADGDDTCLERMISAQLLDGRALWMLRGRCILDAKSSDDYMLCNAMGHPDWPSPRARATEEQIRDRLRALDAR